MELIVVGAVALLLFGPKRLPELAKGLGKGIRDFKKALDGSEEEQSKITPRNEAPPKIDGTEQRQSTSSSDEPKKG